VLTDLVSGRFNTVLSDMAPNTSGHGDDFLSVRLCRRVLELLPLVLVPGGNLLMKVLEGEEFPALLKETKRLFKDSGATKPAASRECVAGDLCFWGWGSGRRCQGVNGRLAIGPIRPIGPIDLLRPCSGSRA